jgi:hypothetical protein
MIFDIGESTFQLTKSNWKSTLVHLFFAQSIALWDNSLGSWDDSAVNKIDPHIYLHPWPFATTAEGFVRLSQHASNRQAVTNNHAILEFQNREPACDGFLNCFSVLFLHLDGLEPLLSSEQLADKSHKFTITWKGSILANEKLLQELGGLDLPF